MAQRSQAMKSYMRDIAEYPLITKDEEAELAGRIKLGDEPARQKLIKSNLRLVVKIAHDFKGYGLPLPDLISEGNIGLIRAAEKFDPEKGAKFSSYSAWWIKQAMRRALNNKSRTIRVPIASADKIRKIRAARIALEERLGEVPSDEEIVDYLNQDLSDKGVPFTKRTVKGLKHAEFRTFSLQDPIQKGEIGSFEDIIADEKAYSPYKAQEKAEIPQELKEVLPNLEEREREILELRYGLVITESGNVYESQKRSPMTLEEVSKYINRTRERVRQIQLAALKKLRDHADKKEEKTGEEQKKMNEWEKAREENPELYLTHSIAGKYQLKELLTSNARISTLGLSSRSLNSLLNQGWEKVKDVASKGEEEILGISYLGVKCYTEIIEALIGYEERQFGNGKAKKKELQVFLPERMKDTPIKRKKEKEPDFLTIKKAQERIAEEMGLNQANIQSMQVRAKERNEEKYHQIMSQITVRRGKRKEVLSYDLYKMFILEEGLPKGLQKNEEIGYKNAREAQIALAEKRGVTPSAIIQKHYQQKKKNPEKFVEEFGKVKEGGISLQAYEELIYPKKNSSKTKEGKLEETLLKK